MRHSGLTIRLIAPLALMGGLIMGSASSASGPAPSWTNERVLDCEGQTVTTYLTPAGFGTPFYVVDSNDVIIPKHVEVSFPDDDRTYVTVHVPGFDLNGKGTVHCSYVDPIGLAVEFWGIRR